MTNPVIDLLATIPFGENKPLWCNAGNRFRADAIAIERVADNSAMTICLSGRVASTQKLSNGFLALPNDLAYLRQVAKALNQIAADIEAVQLLAPDGVT